MERENLDGIIQISTCASSYYNSIVTALCKDGTVWQKTIGEGRGWICINEIK